MGRPQLGVVLAAVFVATAFAHTPVAPTRQTENPADVEWLIRQLGADDFAQREAASRALERIGEPAVAQLRQASHDADAEIRRRAQALLNRVDPELRRQRRENAALVILEKELPTIKRAENETGRPVIGVCIESNPSTVRSPERSARILAQLQAFEQLAALTFDGMTDTGLKELSCLSQIRSLDLHGSSVTDTGLSYLKRYQRLTRLSLGYMKITDSGLKHLGELSQLTELYISCVEVTDAGLKHIAGMKRLTSLSVHSTSVSDAGLEHLKDLTDLTTLHLCRLPLTGAGLGHLKGLNRLTTLNLHETHVTDAHLKVLRRFRLTELYLGSTGITDAGLKHVRRCGQLRELYLHDTKVTDAGLEELTHLKWLKYLSLSGTKVTDAGVQRLQAALPQLEIRR